MVPKVAGSSPVGHPIPIAQLKEHSVLDARTARPSHVLARSALGPFGLWPGHIQAVGQVLPDRDERGTAFRSHLKLSAWHSCYEKLLYRVVRLADVDRPRHCHAQ